MNREHVMNTTTPDERSEKEGLARELSKKSEKEGLARELSSEELETSIIGGVAVEAKVGVQSDVQSMESFQPDLMEGKRCFVGKRKGVQSDVQSMESFQPDLMEGKRC
jgi:hypothetical protein